MIVCYSKYDYYLSHYQVTLEPNLKYLKSLASHRGGPSSIPAQSMRDLWWTKWHWDRFFPEYFGFSLSVSFHRCYVTRKNGRKLVFIFITGLHNEPQGCGASVAFAAGPFSTQKSPNCFGLCFEMYKGRFNTSYYLYWKHSTHRYQNTEMPVSLI
jgi:hypothetical protein